MTKISGRRISRRSMVRAGVGALALRTALSSPQSVSGQSTAQPAQTNAVDQNAIRRRGTGFRALNAAKASAGLTMFAPLEGDGAIYLIDLHGKVAHSWKMPYPPGLYGYLTDKGTLFYNGKIDNDTILGRTPPHGGVVLEADWNGKVLWEVRQPDHHHDSRLLRNGNILMICATALPDDVAQKVQGGRGGPGGGEGGGGRGGRGGNRKMAGDYLVEMTKDGRVVWEWRSWEHLDPASDVIIDGGRVEWTHANGLEELPDGNIMISFRNICTIIQIDRKSGNIIWKMGPPELSVQHAPTLLPNGNILIFDNGLHAFSRVIEVQPSTKTIVWKFQEPVPTDFFSTRIGNAQRLPNGNTLINEGVFGRFFEVTSEGEVVWEYVNPHFGLATQPASQQQNDVFRAYRYSAEQIERARRTV